MKERVGFTGEHKLPSNIPKVENFSKAQENWANIDPKKVKSLKFRESSGKPRSEVFTKIFSSKYEDEDKYFLTSINYEEFLLQNPDKAPFCMKEKGDRRYFFIQPKTASRGAYLSYLSWAGNTFRRFLDVSEVIPWDHTKDRVVAILK